MGRRQVNLPNVKSREAIIKMARLDMGCLPPQLPT